MAPFYVRRPKPYSARSSMRRCWICTGTTTAHARIRLARSIFPPTSVNCWKETSWRTRFSANSPKLSQVAFRSNQQNYSATLSNFWRTKIWTRNCLMTYSSSSWSCFWKVRSQWRLQCCRISTKSSTSCCRTIRAYLLMKHSTTRCFSLASASTSTARDRWRRAKIRNRGKFALILSARSVKRLKSSVAESKRPMGPQMNSKWMDAIFMATVTRYQRPLSCRERRTWRNLSASLLHWNSSCITCSKLTVCECGRSRTSVKFSSTSCSSSYSMGQPTFTITLCAHSPNFSVTKRQPASFQSVWMQKASYNTRSRRMHWVIAFMMSLRKSFHWELHQRSEVLQRRALIPSMFRRSCVRFWID